MFAHDLCHSHIEYLRNSINFNRKDRATRGALAAQALGAAGALALREHFHKYSIFNIDGIVKSQKSSHSREGGNP